MLLATRLIERTAPKKPMAMRAAVEQSVELLAIRVLVSTPWGAPGDDIFGKTRCRRPGLLAVATAPSLFPCYWPATQKRDVNFLAGESATAPLGPNDAVTAAKIDASDACRSAELLLENGRASSSLICTFLHMGRECTRHRMLHCETASNGRRHLNPARYPRGVALYTHHEQLCPPGTKWHTYPAQSGDTDSLAPPSLTLL